MSGLGEYSTSYFSEPSATLDPTLFENRKIRSWVRQGIMQLLHNFFLTHYRHAELWSHPWLAGSGVSYQWAAARHPGDLDCLVGVDSVQFRKANPEYTGLTDKEIAQEINEKFREDLQPKTEDWNGYELTFYVNPGATDIRSINPYAAYDLKYDEWTVTPSPTQHAPVNPAWDSAAETDAKLTNQINVRFTSALQDIKTSHADAGRRNAEVRLAAAKQQATALFDEIHGNRRAAFSSMGEGYYDFNNYRWQANKRTGAIDVLRKIKDHADSTQQYGVELPDASTLIRRAALYRNSM
jgi:hypothetical protein